MATKYFEMGTKIGLMDARDYAPPQAPYSKLPSGTYSVTTSLEHGFHLNQVDHMVVPPKIYGNVDRTVDRIITTFLKRPQQTGVHLKGSKGSGKTLLMKLISSKLREAYGIPTILVEHPYNGEGFNTFMSRIDTPCMVVIDEFEKMYDEDDQEGILTLLDGTRNSKKLFVVTSNDDSRVSSYFSNRPGRFFYELRYSGLTEDFVKDYVSDTLINQSRADSVRKVHMVYGDDMNFDMLQALVEEMNRYDETVQDSLVYLNISKPNYAASYDMVAFESPVPELTPDRITFYRLNVFAPFQLIFSIPNFDELTDEDSKMYDPKIDEDDPNVRRVVKFSPEDIVSYVDNSILFRNKDGFSVTMRRDFGGSSSNWYDNL